MHFLEGRHLSSENYTYRGLSPCLKPCGGNANSLSRAVPIHCPGKTSTPIVQKTAKQKMDALAVSHSQVSQTSMKRPGKFLTWVLDDLYNLDLLRTTNKQPIGRVFRRRKLFPLRAPLPSVQNPAHSKDRSRNSESLQHHEKRSPPKKADKTLKPH